MHNLRYEYAHENTGKTSLFQVDSNVQTVLSGRIERGRVQKGMQAEIIGKGVIIPTQIMGN